MSLVQKNAIIGRICVHLFEYFLFCLVKTWEIENVIFVYLRHYDSLVMKEYDNSTHFHSILADFYLPHHQSSHHQLVRCVFVGLSVIPHSPGSTV